MVSSFGSLTSGLEFLETFSSGVLKNNLGVQKIKFVSTTDEGSAEV